MAKQKGKKTEGLLSRGKKVLKFRNIFKDKNFYHKHERTIKILYSKENDEIANMINSAKKVLSRQE